MSTTPTERTQARPLAAPLHHADGSPIRILVVDDEHTLTDLLQMALRYEGWEVKTAATGHQALTAAREFGLVTKSNLILGMGETREEVSQALRDLHAAGCELVTITQYLRPSVRHHPVERWVKPEEFVELAAEAEEIGFSGVMSGPLVRSSYRAGRLYRQAMSARTPA